MYISLYTGTCNELYNSLQEGQTNIASFTLQGPTPNVRSLDDAFRLQPLAKRNRTAPSVGHRTSIVLNVRHFGTTQYLVKCWEISIKKPTREFRQLNCYVLNAFLSSMCKLFVLFSRYFPITVPLHKLCHCITNTLDFTGDWPDRLLPTSHMSLLCDLKNMW